MNNYLHIIFYNICVKYMFNSGLTCEQYKELLMEKNKQKQ